MAAVTVTASATLVSHVTCLGCGCACDDIGIVVAEGRIVEARHACALGAAWFGDGRVPGAARVDGVDRPVDEALAAGAALLADVRRPLVYLAPGLSCEAQREAVALADRLHAVVDSVSSATVSPSILAAQERGRAGATLGEVRNRADVIVYWGVDPAVPYPRFRERYADAVTVRTAGGRDVAAGTARTVVAVDVGMARGPADVDRRVTIAPGDEVATVTALAALLAGASTGGVDPADAAAARIWSDAASLADTMRTGSYVAVVADTEPCEGRDAGRAAALVALSQALNTATRGALVGLRAGGNRSGADSVLTSQTGFPMAVDYAHGGPQYRPHGGDAGACLARGEVDAVLLVGDAAFVPASIVGGLQHLPVVVIGPRASETPLGGRGGVVVDAAQAGIHEGGTALRLDDVPLPLRPALRGPRGATDLLRDLAARLAAFDSARPAANPGA